ncbi:MAG: LysE family transporter [Bacillus sp. (in: firmicutes)]
MPLVPFLLYVFITSFTPGPNNIMALVFANKYGFKKTIKFCIGVGAGFFFIMVICSYFNLLLKSFLPKIEIYLSIIGAVYMLYLAVKIGWSTSDEEGENEGNHNNFFSGMFLQFINPKGILYGITVVSAFIIPYHASNFSLLLYSLLLGFVGIVSTMCWSVFGSIFQKFLAKYRKLFNIFMALLLVYSALSIVMK